jgi:hypothetical protein
MKAEIVRTAVVAVNTSEFKAVNNVSPINRGVYSATAAPPLTS